MVRNYVRISNRQQWDVNAMESAMQAVLSKSMGILRASRAFNVPRASLFRYVHKKKKDANFKVDKTMGKFGKVFTPEQEKELVQYAQAVQKSSYGVLRMKDVRCLAYQLSEKYGLGKRFVCNAGMAGTDWVHSFLGRHPELSVKTRLSMTGDRAGAFQKEAVSNFFAQLRQYIDEYSLTADRIFACDEIGISLGPEKQSQIVDLKKNRLVAGELITAIVCASAAGHFMPPMLVFPGPAWRPEFELGLPPGGWAESNPSGWMTTELFVVWLERFIGFSKARKEAPVLLLLDGLSAHSKNLFAVDLAGEGGVLLQYLPPKLPQPLDVAFTKSLAISYEDEIAYLGSHTQGPVTLSQVASVFGTVFSETAKPACPASGFEKAGIWPLDPGLVADADYWPDPALEDSRNGCWLSEDADCPSFEAPVPRPEETQSGGGIDEEAKPGCSSWTS